MTNRANIPYHLAIIPDGNRRWARAHGYPTIVGHRQGFEMAVKLGERARALGIKIFTIWAFSTENWTRSSTEIGYLMKLYETMIDKSLKDALKNEIRIIHIGRKDRINKNLLDKITDAENKTKKFTKYYLVIALDYGGRDEIERAMKKMNEHRDLQLSKFLDTKDLPKQDVDLIIRTSGEMRSSGFMIWQLAYAELMFIDKYFPDFTPDDLTSCIEEYGVRQRRFGK